MQSIDIGTLQIDNITYETIGKGRISSNISRIKGNVRRITDNSVTGNGRNVSLVAKHYEKKDQFSHAIDVHTFLKEHKIPTLSVFRPSGDMIVMSDLTENGTKWCFSVNNPSLSQEAFHDYISNASDEWYFAFMPIVGGKIKELVGLCTKNNIALHADAIFIVIDPSQPMTIETIDTWLKFMIGDMDNILAGDQTAGVNILFTNIAAKKQFLDIFVESYDRLE